MRVPADAGVERAAPSNLRLTVLILEGYVYLALIVGIFLAATGSLVWGLLARRPFIAMIAVLGGVPVAATTARALRALWFVCPQPKGIEVGPHFGGQLQRAVKDIAARIGAPRVHRILITDTNNASALQIPRAGIFWPANTLVLGYPLLATLSVDQVRAVIAHELGHMTHAHGRIASWAHRTRLSWLRLMDVLQRHQSVPAHVYLLFRFYVPRLHAHAAAVSRQQELLADRLAAEVTGADLAAQALVAGEIGSYVLDQTFWPRIFDRVEHDPDPPNPFSEMGPGVWSAVEDRALLLERLLTDELLLGHPSRLAARIAALGAPPRWPDAVEVTAADHFFGPQKQELAAALDREWHRTRDRDWKKQHEEIQERRRRLATLAALPAPTTQQTLERGLLTEREGDANAALELYLVAHRQADPAGALAAGRILLGRDDASGIDLIETAMAADPALVEDGCRAVVVYLERCGRCADAHPYEVRRTHQRAKTKMARAERAELSILDRLRPCTDPAVDVARLCRRLASEAGVMRAFLATKELRYSSGTLTILAVLAKNSVASGLEGQLRREGVLPDHVSVVLLGRHDQQLELALDEVSAALSL